MSAEFSCALHIQFPSDAGSPTAELPAYSLPVDMGVLVFTIFVSIMLAAFFVGAFLYHHDYASGDAMRDSLLPFKKETVAQPGGREDSAGAGAGADAGRNPDAGSQP